MLRLLLKLDIMVRNAAIVTYIRSFCENLENYRNSFCDEEIVFW